MSDLSNVKLALAHDSFTQLGGAERVIAGLHEIFPLAPIYTLALDQKYQSKYQDWDIRPSALQKFYNLLPKLKHWLPLIPWAVKSLKIEGYQVVISASSGLIKNLVLPKSCLHIDYCHTPTRFLWIDQDYLKQESFFLLRGPIKILLNRMKKWDLQGAAGVDFFIANSAEVQKRIKAVYGRDSIIIPPFVDCDFWRPTRQKADYFLIGGRLQAHKRNWEIIQIFNETGLPLHVVGAGRQEKALKRLAKRNVIFLGTLGDVELRDEYSGAQALIFPQVEDFGLMPLEAAACGTATIGKAQGGSLETIVPGKTGELLQSFNKSDVKKLLLEWRVDKYRLKDLQQHAEEFSEEKFKSKVINFMRKAINEKALKE